MTTESRREFEEWANNNLLPINKIGTAQVYSSVVTEYAWEAWQAARERQDKHLKFQRDKLEGYLRECLPLIRQQSLCHEQLMFLSDIEYFLEETNPPASEKI